jgi:hypothetical protein
MTYSLLFGDQTQRLSLRRKNASQETQVHITNLRRSQKSGGRPPHSKMSRDTKREARVTCYLGRAKAT